MASGETGDRNQEKFLWFFSKERRRIFGFIYSLVPNSGDAEDVFQQASLSMWKNFSKFDSDREFYPWACGVAYHAVQDFRRSKKRQRLMFSDELIKQLVDDRLSTARDGHIKNELLEECLADLKPKDRTLLNQVYFEGISAAELAAQANRATQTIYNRLNWIRRKLMECVNRKLAAGAS